MVFKLYFSFSSPQYHAFNFTCANYVMGFLVEKGVDRDDAVDLLTVLTSHRHWSLTWAMGWSSLKIVAVQYYRRRGKELRPSHTQTMISDIFDADATSEDPVEEDYGEGCEIDLLEDDERIQLSLEQEITTSKMCMEVGDHEEEGCVSGQEDEAWERSTRVKKKVIRASPAATAGTGRPFNERFNVKPEAAKKVRGPRRNLTDIDAFDRESEPRVDRAVTPRFSGPRSVKKKVQPVPEPKPINHNPPESDSVRTKVQPVAAPEPINHIPPISEAENKVMDEATEAAKLRRKENLHYRQMSKKKDLWESKVSRWSRLGGLRVTRKKDKIGNTLEVCLRRFDPIAFTTSLSHGLMGNEREIPVGSSESVPARCDREKKADDP